MDSSSGRIPTLFESGCSSCPAGDVCPGDVSSPCGCVWVGSKRYDCTDCHILCRDRRSPSTLVRDEDFTVRLAEGRWFDDVTIDHSYAPLDLPVLVPLRVRDLGLDAVPCLTAIGFDLEDLVTRPNAAGAVMAKRSRTRVSLRERVGASSETTIIAVLNGDDDRLEGLWGMDRARFFDGLRAQGVGALTGPTFSVYDDEPASHRTLMMMRQFKVLEEAQAAGIVAVPNLYWRGPYDVRAWADWIRGNPGVQFVSRDFSRTKQDPAFHAQFSVLLDLLRLVDRPLHIIVVGVGAGRGAYVLSRLGQLGCGGTIATASPVIMAQRGLWPHHGLEGAGASS